ncbi:MAG: hypothetical protein R2688_04060 [Fimbriimonadaceae bacterium]
MRVLHGASLDVVAQQLAAKGWSIQNLQMASSVGDPLADQPMAPRVGQICLFKQSARPKLDGCRWTRMLSR